MLQWNSVTDHLHHLGVVEVVDDVLEDVAVRHEAQRPEHDDHRDLLPDVRQDRNDALPNGALLHALKHDNFEFKILKPVVI